MTAVLIWLQCKEKTKEIMQIFGLPNTAFFFNEEKLPFAIPLKCLSIAAALVK